MNLKVTFFFLVKGYNFITLEKKSQTMQPPPVPRFQKLEPKLHYVEKLHGQYLMVPNSLKS